ncbi:hypothetical protein SCHPADRAFT_909873 [Schizopora paradoxa]|uniref:Uncharacterized protein n=1 Tax=Schizopora paradoxa TaxID=27342 RepID=A0A0H2R5A1_9AGAM|nr:hypothetical protein SCHPADRAFT_909873 [Schizopora paradoxa]
MIALRTESPSMASYPSPPSQARSTEEIVKSSDSGSPGITDSELRSESVEQGRQLLIENGEEKKRYLRIFQAVMIFSMFFTFLTYLSLSTSLSIPDTQTSTSWEVVNLCWFSALVLSIASVANTFLGIMIVVYRSDFLLPPVHPRHRVLHAWYKFSPLLLVVIIDYLYVIGDLAFTRSTHQSASQQPLL